MEKPRAAAQSMALSDVAAIQTGGCGFCIGLGSTSTSSKSKNWPWWVSALVGPGGKHDIDRLAKARRALLDRDAEGVELADGEAAARAPVHPSAGEHVEQRDLLGQAQRMVERRERDGRADAQRLRLRRRHGRHHVHRRADREAGEMVLGQPDGVVAGAVHDPEPLEGPVVDRLERDRPIRPAKELQNADFIRR